MQDPRDLDAGWGFYKEKNMSAHVITFEIVSNVVAKLSVQAMIG